MKFEIGSVIKLKERYSEKIVIAKVVSEAEELSLFQYYARTLDNKILGFAGHEVISVYESIELKEFIEKYPETLI